MEESTTIQPPSREKLYPPALPPPKSSSSPTSKLPPWIATTWKQPQTWKTFTRCMIALFATLILMLDQDSLNVLGAAAFFGLIASLILPPSMPLVIFIFATATMLVGMCLGWAWGCAAMAAALRARSQVLLAREVQTAEAKFNHNADIDAQYQASIFQGDYLDPASSAVYGIFFFIGTYFFGIVRATRPKLTILALFGTIVLDLMCSFGPLFPIKEYTLARQLIIPATCYFAIALVCTILIFPESLHHATLNDLINKALRPVQDLLTLQDDVLLTKPSNRDDWSALAKRAFADREKFVAAIGAVSGQAAMLQLEISRGRIGPGELATLIEKTKDIGSRVFGLGSFVMMVEEQAEAVEQYKTNPIPHPHIRAEKRRQQIIEVQSRPGRSLDDLMPILQSSTADLRATCQVALAGMIDWLSEVNDTRWKKPPVSAPTTTDRENHIANLRTALEQFRAEKHFFMLKPFEDLFDPDTGHIKANEVANLIPSVRGLFRCFVLSSGLIHFAVALIELGEHLLVLEKATPEAKFQFPSRFSKTVVANANDSNGPGNPLDIGVDDSHSDEASSTATMVNETSPRPEPKKKQKVYAKNPDAGDPTNVFQKFGRGLNSLWKDLTSNAGIFALKYSLVSIALWIPSVCPSSAYFVYTNRGLWALIMAQMGIGVFTGEQIISFITRAIGTAIGLIVGMIAWYIGAAKGPGNPYGIAASTMVFTAPFLFVRILAPPQVMAFPLMCGVTTLFVIGYSWVDGHVYQTANQGEGAALAGRRALLVLIGFAAAFIIMLIPKPTSAKLLVRKSVAKNIADLGELYGHQAIAFDIDDNTESFNQSLESKRQAHRLKFRSQFLKIFSRLQATKSHVAFSNMEPGLSGPWPKVQYEQLLKIQTQMLSASAVLSGAYLQLNHEWCRRIASKSDLLHPTFIADCLALFAILSNALKNGTPLPPTMPIFERLAYHQQRTLGKMNQMERQLRELEKEKGLNLGLSASESGEVSPAVDGACGSGGAGQGQSRWPPKKRSGENDGEWENDTIVPSHGSVGAPVQTNGLSAHGEFMLHQEKSAFVTVADLLTLESCKFAIAATAIVALVHIAGGLNYMHSLVLSLVGERELDGFDQAQQRWADMDEV